MPVATVDNYRILVDLNKLTKLPSKTNSYSWNSKKVTITISEADNDQTRREQKKRL